MHNCTFADAAGAASEVNRHIGRPKARRAVGSTLLLKGLESHIAIVLSFAVELPSSSKHLGQRRRVASDAFASDAASMTKTPAAKPRWPGTHSFKIASISEASLPMPLSADPSPAKGRKRRDLRRRSGSGAKHWRRCGFVAEGLWVRRKRVLAVFKVLHQIRVPCALATSGGMVERSRPMMMKVRRCPAIVPITK
jgi:hypothetical protein